MTFPNAIKDRKPAMIIQVNTDTPPFDIVAQAPGEPDARYIEDIKLLDMIEPLVPNVAGERPQ